ncbi:MAG: hypothetical protein J5944_08575 [Lentisphaeria bacterium]|nr:hypothetical protein [Lentisphaeria bacterium]
MLNLILFCGIFMGTAGLLVLQLLLLKGVVFPEKALPVVLIAGLVLTVFFFLRREPLRWLRGNFFTLTSLFLLSFLIVSFQVAWDFFLDSPLNFGRYFESEDLLIKSVTFSCVCLGFFLCGYFGTIFCSSVRSKENPAAIPVKLPDDHTAEVTPLVIIAVVLSVLFLLSVDKSYLNGGYSDGMNSTAARLDGYLNRFIYMVIIQIVWNARVAQDGARMTLRKYLRLFPLPFYAVLLAKLSVVLASGDRGPLISIMTILVFGYLLLARRRLGLPMMVCGVLACGMLLSIFKLSGGFGGEGDFSQNFKAAADRLSQKDVMSSVSPYTLELAGSIHAHTVLYEAWENGETYPGIPLIAGTVNCIPAGVTFVSMLFGLHKSQLNTAELATEIAGTHFGLGTTCAGDALATLGLFGAYLLFFGMGVLFRHSDVLAGTEDSPGRYPLFIILFLLLTGIIRLPRGSIIVYCGEFLFCWSVLELNILLSHFKQRKRITAKNEKA